MSDPTTEPVEPTTQPEIAGEESAPSFEKFGDLIQYAPEDYREAKTWDKFRDSDIGTALKTIVDMDRYVGKKGDIPAEDADDGAWSEFWGKVGGKDFDINLPALGEEYGDAGTQLNEYYTDIADQVKEIAADVIPNARSMGEAINGIVGKFLENDAASSLEAQVESQKAMEDQFGEIATKMGVPPDALKSMNNEVIAKYGWGDDTTIYEVLATLAKETSQSSTLKESLVSTPAGKQGRLQEIYSDPNFFDKSSPNYQGLVNEHIKLMDDLMSQNS